MAVSLLSQQEAENPPPWKMLMAELEILSSHFRARFFCEEIESPIQNCLSIQSLVQTSRLSTDRLSDPEF